jgi:hypothetical protein
MTSSNGGTDTGDNNDIDVKKLQDRYSPDGQVRCYKNFRLYINNKFWSVEAFIVAHTKSHKKSSY